MIPLATGLLSRVLRSYRGFARPAPGIDAIHPVLRRPKRSTRRAAISLALLAATALLFALGSDAARAATTNQTLVSNLGLGSAFLTGDWDFSQAFTTGSRSGGYVLRAVKMDFSVTAGTQPSYSLELWSVNSSGHPDTKLATFTNPSSLSNGDNQFDLATAYNLEPSTTYAIVYDQSGDNAQVRARQSSANHENNARAAGWSIANNNVARAQSSTGGWTASNTALRIAVLGSGKVGFSADILVANQHATGNQSRDIVDATFDLAQAFTTGGDGLGYRMTAGKLAMPLVGSTPPTFTVQLCTGSDSDPKSNCLATLSPPASLATGLNTFNAPEGGIELDINTTYYLVLTTTAAGSGGATRIGSRSSDAETNGGVADWSIANGTLTKTHGTTTWSSQSDSLVIHVVGHANPATVANTGQAAQHTVNSSKMSFASDNAQAFTTGSHAEGYTLTRVAFEISEVGDQSPSQTSVVQIRKPGSNGHPGGDLVGTLTAAAGNADFDNTFDSFTHSGLTLDANTKYFVLIDVSAQTDGWRYVLESTTSDDEDSGAAAGWSINNKRYARAFGTTSWASTDEKDSALQIAVFATENDTTAPSAGSALFDRSAKTVAIHFDENLNTTAPANAQFALLDAADTVVQSSASAVSISGEVVTVTFGSVPDNAAKIKYTVPTADPLQDASGNQVAAFTRQLSVVAVSNIGQSRDASTGFSFDFGQAFTTGGLSGGYTLTSVDIHFAEVRGTPSYTVSIHNDASGSPGATVVGTLTKPDSLRVGANTFRASGAALALAANTTYHVVIDLAGYSESDPSLRHEVEWTTSGDEDAGAAAGWSIADSLLVRTWSSTASTWSTPDPSRALVLSIAIAELNDRTAPSLVSAFLDRSAKTVAISFDESLNTTAPADAQFALLDASDTVVQSSASAVSISGQVVTVTFSSINAAKIRYTVPSANPLQDAAGNQVAAFTRQISVVAVSSIGQSQDANTAFSTDNAQAFTTGSDAGGYTLTSVNIQFTAVGSSPSYTVSIHNDASGHPGATVVGTLTKPDSLIVGSNTFTASGTGLALAANTTYHVVIDSSTNVVGTQIGVTSSDNEDAGAGSGWSIANGLRHRDYNSNSATWTLDASVMRIAIVTAAVVDRTAPSVESAVIDRSAKTVTITFDENLKTSATPAGIAFQLVVGNQNVRGGDSVTISGNVVTLTFTAINTGADKIRYIKPSSNPLQDESGNQVATFLKAFTVDTTAPTVEGALADRSNNTVAIRFDEDLNTTAPAGAQFELLDASDTVVQSSPTSAAISGQLVTVGFSSIPSGAAKIRYTKPSANPLQDAAGNEVAAFTQQFSVVAVSSIGQSQDANTAFSTDNAQAFTTGGASGGYRLTSVNIQFNQIGTTTSYTVSIQNDASGLPSTVVGTLTNPASLSVGAMTFWASGSGLALTANTTYHVVIDSPINGVNTQIGVTNSDNEDAGAASGWNIADGLRVRDWFDTTSTSSSWTLSTNAMRLSIAIAGSDTTAPTVESATVAANGTTLTAQLSETGLQGAVVASNWSYTVADVNRGAPTVPSNALNSSAGTITFTLSPAVTQGQVVTLSYNGGSDTNRIRDASDNNLAAFTGRSVTNNSTQQVTATPPQNTPTPPANTPPAQPPGTTGDTVVAQTGTYTVQVIGRTVAVTGDAGSAGSRLTLPTDAALRSLSKLEFEAVAAPDDPPPGGFRIAGSQAIVNITLLDANDNPITGLSSPATVCLPVSGVLLAEADGRPLSLLHYDATAGWTELSGAAVRTVNGTRLLCAQTTRFSPFAIAYQHMTAPANVMASSDTPRTLTLTWDGGENADYYILVAVDLAEYAAGNLVYETASATAVDTTGDVSNLTSGKQYLGLVFAVKGSGADLELLYAEATPAAVTIQLPAVLTAPANVMASSAAPRTLTLTWDGGENADYYILVAVDLAEYAAGNLVYETTSATAVDTTGDVPNLTSGKQYLGLVIAVKGNGADLELLSAEATPAAVTVQ